MSIKWTVATREAQTQEVSDYAESFSFTLGDYFNPGNLDIIIDQSNANLSWDASPLFNS